MMCEFRTSVDEIEDIEFQCLRGYYLQPMTNAQLYFIALERLSALCLDSKQQLSIDSIFN
jgi:hypothetical protein